MHKILDICSVDVDVDSANKGLLDLRDNVTEDEFCERRNVDME